MRLAPWSHSGATDLPGAISPRAVVRRLDSAQSGSISGRMSDSRVPTGREVMPKGTMSLRLGHRAD